jgi:hypothetical protein
VFANVSRLDEKHCFQYGSISNWELAAKKQNTKRDLMNSPTAIAWQAVSLRRCGEFPTIKFVLLVSVAKLIYTSRECYLSNEIFYPQSDPSSPDVTASAGTGQIITYEK